MTIPAAFKFNNTITNDNVAIDDALISAFTDPINPDLQTAFDNILSHAGSNNSSFVNRIINAMGAFDQRSNFNTNLADGTYGFDQFYVLTQSNPIQIQQILSGLVPYPCRMRYIQTNASAQRFGIVQPMANRFVWDLTTEQVVFGGVLNPSADSVIHYAIVEWTGTADSITLDIVNDWTSTNYTPGNFFISSNITVVATGSQTCPANVFTPFSITGIVDQSMTNLYLFVWTESTQAQNYHLDYTNVSFGNGQSLPSVFIPTNYALDQYNCQFFYFPVISPSIGTRIITGIWASTSQIALSYTLPLTMRTTPAFITSDPLTTFTTVNPVVTVSSFAAAPGPSLLSLNANASAASGTSGNCAQLRFAAAGTSFFIFDATL